MYLLYQLYRARAMQLYPQRQGVDEDAQRLFSANRALQSAGNHRPEHDIVTAAALANDHGPSGMKQSCRTHLHVAGKLADLTAQRRRNRLSDFPQLTPALHIRQPERYRRSVDVTQGFPKVTFRVVVLSLMQSMSNEFTIRHRHGQRSGLTRPIEHQLSLENFEPNMIQDEMMELQQRETLVGMQILGN